jgi:hypothetical protein
VGIKNLHNMEVAKAWAILCVLQLAIDKNHNFSTTETINAMPTATVQFD